MIPPLGQWLAATLVVTGTVTARDASNRSGLIRSDTDSDSSLDEWRAANYRTSPKASPRCPSSCQKSDSELYSFLFSDAAGLAACNETMLLSLAVQNNVTDETPVTGIRACKGDYSSGLKSFTPKEDVAAVCSTPNHEIIKVPVSMGEPSSVDNESFSSDHLLSAGYQVLHSLGASAPSCTDNVLTFGYSQSTAVGLFVGAEVHQHGLGAEILGNFLKHAEKASISKATVAQLCQEHVRGADYAVGIIAGSAKNLDDIQETVKTWADGRCISGTNTNQDWMTVNLRVPSKGTPSNSTTTSGFSNAAHAWGKSRLAARDTCKTAEVKKNDGCEAVAKRCGISQDKLKKYNPASDFCSTLVPGQKVCCSSGTLPDPIPPANSDGTCDTIRVHGGDSCGTLASKCGLKPADFDKLHSGDSKFCSTLMVGQHVCCTHGKLPDITPKPNPDGSCSVYTVHKDDDCSVIAASHGLTTDKIESLNKKTWGWNGCKKLWPDTKICLSSGTPPFPQNVPDAECGPTVNGTTKPKGSSSDDWADLNPCPLNVCCNIWGNCGTTDDFCVVSKSDTGAPGTSGDRNGCISSCGRDIVKGDPPDETMRVAYFEAWNINRDCLNMDVDEIDTDKYTHIHFSFANVTEDFKVDISGAQHQFDRFKKMSGIKKIISFGGWDFSTKPGTFNILREATKPKHRATFQKNVIAFLKDNDLDGVDLDWEYPGAPDIPGIPAGDPDAGENYYEFLSGLKSALGSSKSVSFAAPASYWYLKAYPIKKMGSKLDYIIYMTYDLHGQWDYDNEWTSPGCPSGNCLRSHVNITETKDALSIITKAGVPSNKVVVGVTSYGRSFKMADADCTGPMCKFTGSPRESDAAKGRCTNTAGYISDAEIYDIIVFGNVNKNWTDAGSNILVYNDTEWVAYMDADTKADREKLYASYNFAGTSDWAVDLEKFLDGTGDSEPWPDDYEYWIDPNYYLVCDSIFTSLDQIKDWKDKIPPHCMNKYIADVQAKTMKDAMDKYDDLIDDGYDKKFKVYEKYIKEQVPAQINAFMGNGHADKYFKCEETTHRTCCDDCHYATCLEDCDKSDNCKDGRSTKKVTCPTVYKDGSDGIDWYNTKVPNVTYTLEHEDDFYKAINHDYGIGKEWIKFGDTDVHTSNGCQHAGDDIKECQKRQDDWFWNYPEAGKIEVTNPKDIIGKSHDKSKDLQQRLSIMAQTSGFDSFMLSADLVDAGSLPSLTMKSAVDSMEEVASKADEIKKSEREEMILNFVTSLLFFIPVLGEEGAAGMTAVRDALDMIGAAGDAGLMVYGIIEDPKSAFMAVFSTLAGAGLGRGEWSKAASEKRSMPKDDVEKLGPVKDKLHLIEDVRERSCKI